MHLNRGPGIVTSTFHIQGCQEKGEYMIESFLNERKESIEAVNAYSSILMLIVHTAEILPCRIYLISGFSS